MSLNKQTKRSVLALSVAAAVGGFSVPSAFSQSVLMEEVIVTAQKRALMERADEAMYQAKAAGRNQFRLTGLETDDNQAERMAENLPHA